MKRSFLKYILGFLATIVCFVFLRALLFGAPVITLKNNSDKQITSVILSGAGFSNSIIRLEPHTKNSVVVHPKGDSGLQIEFTVDGEIYKKDDLAYLQDFGGYCVTIQIAADLTVSSDIGPLPIGCPKLLRVMPW